MTRAPVRVSATAMVAPVGRGTTQLPPLRHEFGDTKHRRVTYTLTANSRFRAFYDDGAPDDFRTSASTPEVIVPNSARTMAPTEELLPYVTLLGRDAIWNTAIPPLSPALNGTPVVLSETGRRVLAVGHPVWSHGESWYADIPLPATNSYSPLVRPAVTCLQPHSLPGLSLSPVVRTDFVPLPDRTLTVQPVPDDEVRSPSTASAPTDRRRTPVHVAVERLTDAGVDGTAADPDDPEAAG